MLAASSVSRTIFSSSSSNSDPNLPKSKRPPPFQDSKASNSPASLSPLQITTPPWMIRPLLAQPHHQPLKLPPKRSSKTDKALFGKESGVRGNKDVKKIVLNLEKLSDSQVSDGSRGAESGEVDWLERIDSADEGFGGKMPWSIDKDRVVLRRAKKERAVTAAEMTLDKCLLTRLRSEAARMCNWVKVKKAGVTEVVVDDIRLVWRKNELAMVKFDVPLCRNMDRAREILEMKTGGLVVWSKKDVHVIYNGSSFQSTATKDFSYCQSPPDEGAISDGKAPLSIGVRMNNGSHSLHQRETDRLLEGLGPRYIDWWMQKPLPVDADLLPEVVPGFRPPVRRGPPDTRVKLINAELTYLRKLAHPLPFHFVIGRNRKLQGLAVAILKLWEKCVIAKIAVKWGVPNTKNAQMALELKRLTGGVLLLRNKFLIILYRGKDFLPCGVASLVAERENVLKRCELIEESARLKATESFHLDNETLTNTRSAGTLSEFWNIQNNLGNLETGSRDSELQLEAKKVELEKELRLQERKLSILDSKIEKSANELAKLASGLQAAEHDIDREIIIEEERACLRNIGLKLNGHLVLGRRGVFDGIIEGIHQHWRHREVVKVLTMQKSLSQVSYSAKILETLSGGILISVEKLKEGHAIIIYRGKNYQRPSKLLTDNLLNRRDALRRSLEMQTLGSLKYFAYQRRRSISELKQQLAKLQDPMDGTSAIEVLRIPPLVRSSTPDYLKETILGVRCDRQYAWNKLAEAEAELERLKKVCADYEAEVQGLKNVVEDYEDRLSVLEIVAEDASSEVTVVTVVKDEGAKFKK